MYEYIVRGIRAVFLTVILFSIPLTDLRAATEDPLLMGIFPRRNAMATVSMFKPMAKYLSQQLGREVKLVTSKNLKTFSEGVATRKYDIVHFNQYQYVQANKNSGYQVVLKNEEFGHKTIAGSILVRKDSGIQSVEDLRGKKLIFGGGKAAMISYIVPTYLLRQAGLQANDYVETFAKNPPHSVLVVYHKQADAGGLSSLVVNFPAIKKKIDTSQMKTLLVSQQLSSLPWAVKDSLDKNLIKEIQSSLVALNNTGEGKKILNKAVLTAIHSATDDEYDIHREIIFTVLGEDYRKTKF